MAHRYARRARVSYIRLDRRYITLIFNAGDLRPGELPTALVTGPVGGSACVGLNLLSRWCFNSHSVRCKRGGVNTLAACFVAAEATT